VPAKLFEVLLVVPELLDLVGYGGAFVLVVVEVELVVAVFLDFAGDVPEEVPGAHLKVAVHIDIVALIVANLAEAVHVELADEGGEVAVLEVHWQDVLRELRDIFN
jgi:hypothetical protein